MKKTARTARGYDLYGNIAVIDAPPKSAKTVARRMLSENGNIETVLRKGGAVKGRYRTRRFVYVAGKKNYIATYRENGCVFKFDIRRTFFSTRLAFERKRISDLVKDGERVVVMFGGVGPYSIEIAKQYRNCEVISIELNPAACAYARENARLNKTPNVAVEHGSVEKFEEKYAGFADRIIMPLPNGAARFLTSALLMCGRRCTIHYYAFCKIGGVKQEISALRTFFAKRKKKFKLLGYRTARPYSARDVEVAVDFMVS
ncbi:MAG: hypothetical protein KGH57_03075 [Candidatus Micrarchaeota archaeon]|nr:hypothetical protein [Candidatus Micrarchaeota archaeon]